MIGRVWRWLFDAHRHEWETVSEERYTRFRHWQGKEIPTGNGTLHTQRCKTCGIVRGIEIGVRGD